MRHSRLCDEEDSGLADEEQKRKGTKNCPKYIRKRMHQDEKNFLEKFKTVSKQANTVFRRLAVLNFQSIELVNEKLCFKEKALSVCSSAFSNHLANIFIRLLFRFQQSSGEYVD